MAGAEVGGAATVPVCCRRGLKIDLRPAAMDEGVPLAGVDLQQELLLVLVVVVLLLVVVVVAVGEADLEKRRKVRCVVSL